MPPSRRNCLPSGLSIWLRRSRRPLLSASRLVVLATKPSLLFSRYSASTNVTRLVSTPVLLPPNSSKLIAAITAIARIGRKLENGTTTHHRQPPRLAPQLAPQLTHARLQALIGRLQLAAAVQ